MINVKPITYDLNLAKTVIDNIYDFKKSSKEVEGLDARYTELANKEAEQQSKGIDWAEFDKQDQIIFSSND